MHDLKDRIYKMVEDEYMVRIKPFCSDVNPIKWILEVALKSHTTPQCKVRCCIEGLYSWYKISKDEFYLELTDKLIEYANLVFNNRLEMNIFRELILERWLDYSAKDFPYIVMDFNDRMKSLVSELNDLVDKTLKMYICKDFATKIDELFKEDEREEAAQIVNKLVNKYDDSRNRDIYGVMFVVDYYDRIRDCDDPEMLKLATLKLAQNCVEFMELNNITIVSLKDFISEPKDNSYSCFQFVIQGTKSPLEIQFRSLTMHHRNEDPNSPASHKKYKNTEFNNFLNAIVSKMYGMPIKNPQNFQDEIENEEISKRRLGITDGIPLFSIMRIHRTPNGEIPKKRAELEKFEEVEMLAELYAKHFRED